jgi:hypothetical protein
MRSLAPLVACVCISGFLAACGGSQPEAKEPDDSAGSGHGAEKAEKAESHEAKADKEKDDDGDGDDDKASKAGGKKDDKKSDKGSDEGSAPKALRSAQDIVTGKDVLFVFSFNESEPFQAAEKKCAEKSKDDPKKKADCMSKASAQFDLDGITFEQIDGTWMWLTMRRKGNQLLTIHKIPVEFSDDKEKSVKIKTLGPDKGSKPMAHVPKELTIEVPAETQLTITDPKSGKMVYEAKMGLKGDAKR